MYIYKSCLAYGAKYPLQKFLELDPDELSRTAWMAKSEIDIALQCVSSAFYPFSRRQTLGSLQM